MFTQHFRPFFEKSSLISLFLSLLAVSVLLLGCEAEEGPIEGDPALTDSSLCEPACSGSRMGCFFDEDASCPNPPCVGCYERTCPPDNPIQACAAGAVCLGGVGVCAYPNVCNPECGSGKHCVAGKCIPNYSQSNVCDPLANCRNQCGPNAGCIAACENDRSSTCRSCIDRMSSCENRDNCKASATGCCAESYCDCFPTDSGCSGKPCANCWENCNGDIPCFNTCASGSAACATCLQPFNARPDCKATNPPDDCEALFFGCIE